jgi:hypothetical protein
MHKALISYQGQSAPIEVRDNIDNNPKSEDNHLGKPRAQVEAY